MQITMEVECTPEEARSFLGRWTALRSGPLCRRRWNGSTVAIFGLVADPEAIHRPMELLGGLMPANASAFLADQMRTVALTSRAQLGAGLGGAALSALWGAWSGASGLIAALNVACREEETRSFLRRLWDALVIAVATGICMLLTFALIGAAPSAN